VLCVRRIISRILKQIERVQRRFSKRLPGLKEFTCEERLKFMAWPTLELRRLHTDLIWSYKILFGLVHLNSVSFLQTQSKSN